MCISSKFDTGIQTNSKIAKITTALMSYSQLWQYSLTLRHAWLNLKGKHMTTGRINQVPFKGGKYFTFVSLHAARKKTLYPLRERMHSSLPN